MLPIRIRYAVAAVVMILLQAVTGCATGYQLQFKKGVETLYHIDASGTKQIVYVVNKDGSLQIHNQNDPLVKCIYSDLSDGTIVQATAGTSPADDTLHQQQMLATKLIQTGRIKVAEKRHATDPIFVTVRAAGVDAAETPKQAREKNRKEVMGMLTQDHILAITPESGDVDIFFKSYVRETAAVNIQTKKLVNAEAFYFEALVRSNYLPQDSYTICELGHLMDRREVIKRTAQRVRKIIKEKIGPNIPKDRARFLPSQSKGI